MAKYAGPDNTAATTTSIVGADTDSGEPVRFSVRRMARLLNVSTSGYYAHVTRAAAEVLTARMQRRADLAVKILDVHADSDGTYGSPRITAELRERGETVNEKTIAAIMAGIGIEGISPRTFKVRTTVVDPNASFPPDRVRRRFDQGRLDAVWMTDITYLTCGEGDMFLCAIRDGHSRRVLGHVVAEHIGADMVCEAIKAAVTCREEDGHDVAGTILHSDRGAQYTSAQFADAADALQVRLSIGRRGQCWDNAVSESFFATIKNELTENRSWATHSHLKRAVFDYIEGWYNTRRRHSSLGQLSPAAFETGQQRIVQQVA